MPAIILNPTPSPSQVLAIWIADEQKALDYATRCARNGELGVSQFWLETAARSRAQAELWAQAA